MTTGKDMYAPGMQEVLFLPLGGAGEIGMNLSLFGHAGKWLMVDLGITFGDETTPGIDVLMPDPSFIRDRREDLLGLVITHAHEDHLGAVSYLWQELRCPVYATPFAAAVLRAKASDRGMATQIKIKEQEPSGRFNVGSFDVEFVGVTHSVPEAQSMLIRVGGLKIFHTGDWKLDPQPIVGLPTDEKRLAQIGDEGVDVMICDSTNALVEGVSGSEAEVRDTFLKIFSRFRKRIAVTCFSTNVARIESIVHAALAHGRSVALVGRSLWRIYDAARATGFMSDLPEFLTGNDAAALPRDKVVFICTGSQGEPRSALARISHDDHPEVVLEEGDVCIFSSREIPGNERAIGRVQNALIGLGCDIITAEDERVHVSGHPARDELRRMYELIRPNLAIPVHGEERHLLRHAQLARECRVPAAILPENGTILRLHPGPVDAIGQVEHGRLALDGNRLIRFDGSKASGRMRMLNNGAVVVTLILDSRGALVTDAKITVLGLLEGEDEAQVHERLTEVIRDAVDGLAASSRYEDGLVRQAVRAALRRHLMHSHGKKPDTQIHLVRL